MYFSTKVTKINSDGHHAEEVIFLHERKYRHLNVKPKDRFYRAASQSVVPGL